MDPKVKAKIIQHYPHLKHIKNDKVFAQNATRLAAVPGVKPADYYQLAKLAERKLDS